MCTSARAVDTSRHATAMSTRPHVQAHDNTLRRMAATATRPCVQAHNNTSCRMAATAARPCAQAHNKTSCCMVAMATRPCAQAHDNTLHHTGATATRPCAQAHDNTSCRTVATTTRTGATKMMKSSTKPCIHVALHSGDNDNNYGDDNNECQQRGLVHKRTAFSYRVAQMQRQQKQLATTNDECRTTKPCARAHDIIAIVRKRTCYASNIDATTSQAMSNLDGHELHCQT
jgi:hypothetical protein